MVRINIIDTQWNKNGIKLYEWSNNREGERFFVGCTLPKNITKQKESIYLPPLLIGVRIKSL